MIAFYLPGGVPVYTYSILLGVGASLGLLWAAWQAPPKRALVVVNAGLFALLGGLLGGRLVYVLARWSYYQVHWQEIPQFYQGGLAWAGVLVGGILALLVFAGLVSLSAGLLLDSLLPLIGLLAVSAWLGCWLDGCAYGATSTAWWALPARNEWGVIARRVPVQFAGAILILVTFGMADWLKPRIQSAGQISMIALTALLVEMLVLSFLRADPAPAWRGLHLESWAALSLALIFLVIVLVQKIVCRWNRHRSKQAG
jgi:phosphatidylglycerol---prolipoprotein diacylglyceryl transferase